MAFHYRSQSEKYQPQISQQPQTIESIIREHTDSQQSLDRLFNPTTPSVPLRSRNLPRSFFDPGLGTADDSTTLTTNGTSGSRFHSRSISYGQQPQPQPRALAQRGSNFHIRTSSTLAPMSDYNSNQSSYECLNSSSARLNTMNNTHDQQVTPMSTDSMPATQQVEYAPSTEWFSPETSLEELRSPTSADIHYQQPTTSPHVQSAGCTINQTNPQSPIMQPSATLRQNHMCMQPNGTGPVGPPYQTHESRPQLGNNYDHTQNATNFTCPNSFSNNLHSRSMSFDQNRLSETHQVSNQRDFHIRTSSTLTPMPNGLSSNLNSNSVNRCEISREFVNCSNINQSATGWSSSGYSSDDMTAGGGNFWASRAQRVNEQQNQILPSQPYHYHQPMQTRAPINMPHDRPFESGLNASSPTNPTQQPVFKHHGEQVFHGRM